jgi:hypothetical protein
MGSSSAVKISSTLNVQNLAKSKRHNRLPDAPKAWWQKVLVGEPEPSTCLGRNRKMRRHNRKIIATLRSTCAN